MRERERREHLNRMMKEHHHSDAYHGGGATEAADDIQMRTVSFDRSMNLKYIKFSCIHMCGWDYNTQVH